MLLEGPTDFWSPSLAFPEKFYQRTTWADSRVMEWLIDWEINVNLTSLYEGSWTWISELPEFHCYNHQICQGTANAYCVNQQGLVNDSLAQRESLHWQLSVSTNVLVFGVSLGRSHLVAGKVKGQPTLQWFCLQYHLETAPPVLLCLPATRWVTTYRFLKCSFSQSPASPSWKRE